MLKCDIQISPLSLRRSVISIIQVEFNKSKHSSTPGSVNVYKLGSFVSHNVGTIYTVNNCIFLIYGAREREKWYYL
jgi:hypothetical protein